MLRKKILEKFVGRGPEDSAFRSQTHFQIGTKLSGKGLLDLALAEFMKATKLNPEFAEAHMELGSIYLKLDRPEEAIKAYNEALRIRPEYVEVYDSLALAYDHCGNFIKALGMYMRAIRHYPGSVDLQRNLGLAFFNSGNYPEAIKAYGRAIQISPEDGRAYYYLGLVHLDLEDREAAMAMQAKLKELGANDLAAQLLDEVARQTWRLPPGSDRELELLAGDSRSR